MASEESLVKLYLAIGETERHFNTIQSNYRLLASTWTLACFTGIGFVLTSTTLPTTLDRELICIGIAFSGSVSVLILWHVDIFVYQRLLSAFYNEGRVMEAMLPWLSQVRNETRRTFKRTLSRSISLYYVLLFAFLCVVAIIFSVRSNGIDFGYHPISAGPVKIGHVVIGRWWCTAILGIYCVLTSCWLLWRVWPRVPTALERDPKNETDENHDIRCAEFESAISIARARAANDRRSRLRARGVRVELSGLSHEGK